MASSRRAQSRTLRAMGPSVESTWKGVSEGPLATRPGAGLSPTMPQKLAGLRSEPPMSEPWASQAVPLASAAAAPPEEPAAESRVSQGLRVGGKTSLKVLAPAPNSGVLDLA